MNVQILTHSKTLIPLHLVFQKMSSFTAEYSFSDLIFFPLCLNRMSDFTLGDRALPVVTDVTKFESLHMKTSHISLPWIPIIPSPVMHVYAVKIVFSCSPM